jgi:hypothetical protein
MTRLYGVEAVLRGVGRLGPLPRFLRAKINEYTALRPQEQRSAIDRELPVLSAVRMVAAEIDLTRQVAGARAPPRLPPRVAKGALNYVIDASICGEVLPPYHEMAAEVCVALGCRPGSALSPGQVYHVWRLLKFVPAALERGGLSHDDLNDELAQCIFNVMRLEGVAAGRDFRGHYYAPGLDAIIVAFCAEHTDKNCTQSLGVKKKQAEDALIQTSVILAAGRMLAATDPICYTLIAPYNGSTDMQSTDSMAWPTICPKLLFALAGTKEGAFLEAVGFGYRGRNLTGLNADARVLLVEILRQAAVLNIMGSQLCRPFGGGAKRIAAGRPTGVQAQAAQGLVAGNLLRFLIEGDARAALRRSSAAWYRVMLDKVWNTNVLENGFATLKMLCGGCKPELVQCLSALARADLIELIKHSRDRVWEMKRRGKVAKANGMYAEHGDADGRLAKSANWNNGCNLDPTCPGVHTWEAGKQRNALSNATAKNDSVRSNFAQKGLGKEAKASIVSTARP